MRKKKIIAALVLATVSALTFSAPASAHVAGPCVQTAEPGHSEYAQHHIVPLVGQESEHVPGEHRGFSACNPSGR